jgi:hypothetical protein
MPSEKAYGVNPPHSAVVLKRRQLLGIACPFIASNNPLPVEVKLQRVAAVNRPVG